MGTFYSGYFSYTWDGSGTIWMNIQWEDTPVLYIVP